ncbi:hypothetical protein SNE40_000410 [Patella caerulea]
MLTYKFVLLCIITLVETHSNHLTDMEEIRVVIVGKTGAGKSSLANVLLNNSAFVTGIGSNSITEKAQSATAEVKFPGFIGNKRLVVVDTPGMFCTRRNNDEIAKVISRCVEMLIPGPHVFIYAISGSERFTDEDLKTFNQLKLRFGDDFTNHAIVVFTKIDPNEVSEFANSQTEELKNILAECNNSRTHINTKTPRDCLTTEVDSILKLIYETVQKNGGNHYNSFMFRQAEKRREDEKKREEEKLRMEREREFLKWKLQEAEAKRKEDEKKREEEEKKRHEESGSNRKTTDRWEEKRDGEKETEQLENAISMFVDRYSGRRDTG